MRRFVTRLVVFAVLLLTVSPGWSQGTSEVGVGYVWRSSSGSKESFASQYALDSGLFLAGMSLDLRSWIPGYSRLSLEASGFGAEPFGRARFVAAWDQEWRVELGFTRRERFFSLPSWDFGQRREAWTIEQWEGKLAYEGFSWARLQLSVRDVRRHGWLSGPFYGLGRPYVGEGRLAQELREAFFAVESKGLPVRLLLEQGVSHARRHTSMRPGNGGLPADGEDPDTLDGLRSSGDDKSTSPVTRLAASWESGRWDVGVEGLYRKDRGVAERAGLERYALGEGVWGSLGFADALKGQVEGTVKKAEARVGLDLGRGLSLTVRAGNETSERDSVLLGSRFVILTGPGGGVEIPVVADDNGFFDVRDRFSMVEARYRVQGFGLVVFRKWASRDVRWQLGRESSAYGPERDTEGWGAVASFSNGGTFSAELGGEKGSFERYVFRIEPESTKRAWAKLRYKPQEGIELSAAVRSERADNPSSVSNLAYESRDLAVSATLRSQAGAWLDVSFSRLELGSDVDIQFFAPALTPGVSSYRLRVNSAAVHGFWPVGPRWELEGGYTLMKDNGRTFPFVAHNADLQVSWKSSPALALSLFANVYSFDGERANNEDFDVKRLGVACWWRF